MFLMASFVRLGENVIGLKKEKDYKKELKVKTRNIYDYKKEFKLNGIVYCVI